jgi:hypothetical protein
MPHVAQAASMASGRDGVRQRCTYVLYGQLDELCWVCDWPVMVKVCLRADCPLLCYVSETTGLVVAAVGDKHCVLS